MKPFVSIVLPAFNEETIIEENLNCLYRYMKTLDDKCNWELIIVNDGSKDKTGALAEKFASGKSNAVVIHHCINRQLGEALRTGFRHCKGDYVITMDLDLSYAPDHIEKLLLEILNTRADIVIASPYMNDGKVINVPWQRRWLSRIANYFLSITYNGKLHTITGMVRVYNRNLIDSINLKAMDMEINAEILYKANLLRARVIEIPAKLDWSLQKSTGKSRASSMRILRGIMGSLMAGFIFRPYLFFNIPGILLFFLSLYIITWIFINTFSIFSDSSIMSTFFDDQFSRAVYSTFKARPHAFIVGGITLVVSLQFLSLGILSLQNKRYFEEMFHLCTRLIKGHLKLEQQINDTRRNR